MPPLQWQVPPPVGVEVAQSSEERVKRGAGGPVPPLRLLGAGLAWMGLQPMHSCTPHSPAAPRWLAGSWAAHSQHQPASLAPYA